MGERQLEQNLRPHSFDREFVIPDGCWECNFAVRNIL